ncbi:MAG: helix-turn-helix transcriptional regulator [Betaproteobacteria bacterium]|nr:helix-turn-helix transcriptional regulator [Betaproteobacteria bacterium]
MPNPLHRYQYEIFRKLLVGAREEAGLTQVQVAARLGKPQSFVSKYERGERRLDFTEFLEVADILGVDASAFIARYRASQVPSEGRSEP